jgi:amino acid transporter
VVAIVIIALLTYVNTRGIREAKWVQNVFTFAKTAALAALVLLGLTLGRNAEALSGNFHNMFTGMPTGTALILAFGGAMVGSLFSSDAWNNVTFAASEVKNPARNLPIALAVGTATVTGLYLLANIAYLSVLKLSELQTAPQDRVGTLMLEHIFGSVGAYLMAAAILVSTFGCINGLILAGARVYYAMARDNLFFKRAGTALEARRARHVAHHTGNLDGLPHADGFVRTAARLRDLRGAVVLRPHDTGAVPVARNKARHAATVSRVWLSGRSRALHASSRRHRGEFFYSRSPHIRYPG